MMRGGMLKAGLALVGIFLAGAVAGGIAGMAWQKRQAQHIDAREFTERHLRRVTRALDLSDQQVERIRPILLGEYTDRIREVRARSFNEMGQILREMNRRFEAELTPEQLVKHREFHERMRERFQREADRRDRRGNDDRRRGHDRNRNGDRDRDRDSAEDQPEVQSPPPPATE